MKIEIATRPARRETMTVERRPTQKITPFLWFDGNAEEAVSFYTSVFQNSRITAITRYGRAGAQPPDGPRERS